MQTSEVGKKKKTKIFVVFDELMNCQSFTLLRCSENRNAIRQENTSVLAVEYCLKPLQKEFYLVDCEPLSR